MGKPTKENRMFWWMGFLAGFGIGGGGVFFLFHGLLAAMGTG